MIVELGHIALILALTVSLLQGLVPWWGFKRGNTALFGVATNGARITCVLLLISYCAFTYAFLTNDFSLLNVANHSNTHLPWYYRVAATWGSHEGSILFWAMTLALWSALFSATKEHDLVKVRVLAILGLIEVGIVAFTLFTSNPFLREIPFPAEGADLNPLLQDPGMIFHPPLLYIGYVGFSVPFAFALAALLFGDLTAPLARRMRAWTLSAWIFLTLGIALGSYWSYYELGWGGWWFWDPVENASLMPWLTGTALIHSLIVSDKRSSLKIWSVFLAILTFSLSLLGTFLVRSGVLTSVHAFSADPQRGVFILAFLVIVIGLSFELFAWKAPLFRRQFPFDPISRESSLLLNNLLFVVACAAILLGTLYPLILDALTGAKISVGPPYFEKVLTPVFLAIFALMGLSLHLRWKGDELTRLCRPLVKALGVALLFAAATLCVKVSSVTLVVSATLVGFALTLLCLEPLAGAAPSLFERLRHFRGTARSIAHLGLVIFVVGVAVSSAFSVERDARMAVGDTLDVQGYRFTMVGQKEDRASNYETMMVTFDVSRDGKSIARLTPEKRQYNASGMVMTEAAIRSAFWGDLYVSLGDKNAQGDWVVRAYVKPAISWIWWGTLLMALGGLLALLGRTRPRSEIP